MVGRHVHSCILHISDLEHRAAAGGTGTWKEFALQLSLPMKLHVVPQQNCFFPCVDFYTFQLQVSPGLVVLLVYGKELPLHGPSQSDPLSKAFLRSDLGFTLA